MRSKNSIWKIVYTVWPLLLRALEKFRFHNSRQNFLIGHLAKSKSPAELNEFLISQGYEPAILAWKDPGEGLSLRKLEGKIFQYHIRLFDDGEIRVHYEYSSEGNPLGHVTEKIFEPKTEYFLSLLSGFIVTTDTLPAD